ncbi:MAG: radical SAM protein [bacterium]
MRAFHFVNKSCNRRQEEVHTVGDFLRINGWKQTDTAGNADLVILFTCAFCHSRVTDMLDEIGRIRAALKDGAELIVGSCLPKTDPARLQSVFNGKIIHPTDFSALDSLPGITVKFDAILDGRGQAAASIGAARQQAAGASPHNRKEQLLRKAVSFVRCGRRLAGGGPAAPQSPDKRKIIFLAAGCRRLCSYCAIRFATGKLRSKPLDWVLWQFRDGVYHGFGKFELYADSIGDYGMDIGTDLGHLFEQLLAMREQFTIGVYDLHPASFLKYYDQLMALCRAGKVHFLYVPLQSGNARIMKLMRRPCDPRDLRQKLLNVKHVGGIFLQTSIIAGFPSETEEEFQDTVDFLTALEFDDVYVHFYSDMPGTESSEMDGKIDKETMRGRMDKIMAAGIRNQIGETRHEWENIPI